MEMCWHCWRLVLCRWRGVCAWKRPSDVWVGMIECVVVRMRMDGRMSEQEVCELQACSGGLRQELWTRRSPSHSYPSTASGGWGGI